MNSVQSDALEPTKDELVALSNGARIIRLIPVYGLVILMLGLALLFSVLLPNTFPTLLNMRAIISGKAIIALLSLAAAAKWAIGDGGADVGVVIFTDSTYQIAIDKADRIKKTIEEMGGKVLEYVDTPIADASTRMGPLTTSLLQKYGASWTHSLAINDLYFDFMGPALAAAGIAGDGAPKAGSAGDGSEAAFQRIRSGQYQTITVAEPLNLQGWQIVDELNRAIQGEACSGYVTAPALVTQEGLAKMGDSNTFDPDSPYRAAYTAIWK